MNDGKSISRRGVYYDLTLSPYEYNSSYGDSFKFSSKKKLEIFTRDAPKELKRVDDLLTRYELNELIPDDIVTFIKRSVLQAFYRYVER